MVHPFEQTLDTSLHDGHTRKAPTRRRSSLDNSCLSADHSLLQILAADDGENYETNRPRRFSLTHKFTATATFLADGFCSGHSKTNSDLDLDCHDSKHEATTRSGGRRSSSRRLLDDTNASNDPDATSSSQEEEGELTTEEVFSTTHGSDMDDDSSECDSFCDASVQEQANKEYILTDLGASCFWGPEAHFYDMTGDFEKYSDPSSLDQKLMEVDERMNGGGRSRRGVRGGFSGGASTSGSVDLGPSPEEEEEEEDDDDDDDSKDVDQQHGVVPQDGHPPADQTLPRVIA